MVDVTVGVVPSENLEGLVVLVLGNQVTRRLWDPPDEAELDQRGESLEKSRDSPRPLVAEVVCAKRQPRDEEGADIPETVVNRCQTGSVLRVANLRQERGRCQLREGVAETHEETTSDEDPKSVTSTLHDSSHDHDHTANNNGNLAAKVVGEPWDDSNRSDTADLVDRSEQTKHRALWVTEMLYIASSVIARRRWYQSIMAHIFPCLEVLDTVEKHAIVTRGGGSDTQDEGVPVELPQARLLCPADTLELRSLLLGNDRCLLVGRLSLEDAHVDGRRLKTMG